jgi:hypothetical protein
MAAGDDTSEVVVLAGYTPDEAGFTSETVTLASFTPPEAGFSSEVVTLVSYIWITMAGGDISGQLDVDRPLVGNFARRRKVE